MLCPVCKTECGEERICPECGFDDLSPIFINCDEVQDWTNNKVIPYRKKYWKEQLLDFSIKETTLIRYTGDSNFVKIPFGGNTWAISYFVHQK